MIFIYRAINILHGKNEDAVPCRKHLFPRQMFYQAQSTVPLNLNCEYCKKTYKGEAREIVGDALLADIYGDIYEECTAGEQITDSLTNNKELVVT